jgi:hypothetical protein
VLCALLLSPLALARWLPVYTDEVWWKAFRSRLFLDFGYSSLHGLHLCTSHAAHPEPWYFLPFRLVDAWLYQDPSDPMTLRAWGIAQFLVVVVLMSGAIAKILRCELSQLPYGALAAVSFLAMGILPFAMVMNRPEQMTLVCLLGLILIAVSDRPSRASAIGACVLAIGVLAYNIRGLYFIPWVALAVWMSVRWRPAQLAILAGLVAIALHAYRFYSVHASCPELPVYDQFLAAYRTSPADLLGSPLASLSRMAENLAGAAAWFSNPEFRARYLSDWLPSRAAEAMRWDRAVNLAIHGVQIAWFLPATILGLLPLARRSFADVRKDARYRLGLMLAACLAASASLVNYKNDYEMALALPLCFLASLLVVAAWTARTPRTRLHPWLRGWLVGSLALGAVVALASTLHLRASFGSIAQTTWRTPGGVPDQPFSVSTVRTPESSELVLRAAARCGITPSATLDRLVVDDWTISEFWQGTRPQYVFFLTTAGFREFHPTDFFETYRRSAAPGLIAQCHFLPPDAQRRATQTQGLCCLPSYRHF